MISIKEVITKKELKAFVKFPFSLYKNSNFWVPPIISEELQTFDKNINPVFQNADGRFFLAYENGKIVGRINAGLMVLKPSINTFNFILKDILENKQIDIKHEQDYLWRIDGF